jgi:putative ABC transport system permease protein
VIRFIWSQLRGRAGRSGALLAGVLVATTGFTVLTGATATGRLEVTGTVDANARAAYDILVRPKGSRTPLETDAALVRANSLSGQFGGITMGQYEQVRGLAGVDVAAPIAMLGYTTVNVSTPFDITGLIDKKLDQQVIRVDPTFTADRGLSKAVGAPTYVLVSKHHLVWPKAGEGYSGMRREFADGHVLSNDQLCYGDAVALDLDAPGGPKPICEVAPTGDINSDRAVTYVDVYHLLPDGRFETDPAFGPPSDKVLVYLRVHMPFLVAAVDPVQEDKLVGLSGALTAGRYLTAADKYTTGTREGRPFGTAPVMATSRSYVDAAIQAKFSRLPTSAPVAGLPIDTVRDLLKAVGPLQPLDQRTEPQEPAFQQKLREGLNQPYGVLNLNGLIRTGPPVYTQAPDGSLVVATVPPDPEVYSLPNVRGLLTPWQSDDTSFRTMTRAPGASLEAGFEGRLVGLFDPGKLTSFSELSRVPMEAYQPPGITGSDAATRDRLGGQPLLPNGNPAGYVAEPPMFLTSLAVVPGLGPLSAKAPISAIRVRVAGVSGFSKASRERVRLVAEQIATRTGLDVDITYGSSAAPQTVQLAPGVYGRPELRLTEGWSKKGVAAAIVTAVDRKSAVLFLLVLVVCALFLLNAVSAAVRDRRAELAVLACLGWPGRRIGAAVLIEVLGVGFAAGLLGLAISIPLAAVVDVRLTGGHALLAVPVALGLTLVAGIVPALRAARAHPADALRPAVRRTKRRRRPPGVFGLAVVNLGRVPGRTLLGALALAIGIAALTMLAAITFAFRGAIVGTVLGDAVSLQVRGVDTVAVVATVLLGAFAVADVLYLNIRDRAHELASLRAAGWSDGALGRLITYEGVCMGILGALIGAGAGLAGAGWLVGTVSPGLITTGVLTAAAGVVVAALSARVPAMLLRRLPIAQLLAEE